MKSFCKRMSGEPMCKTASLPFREEKKIRKKIFIRTDASREIATGHIMRCLSIAHALRERKADVTFLFSNQESADVFHALKEEPYSYLLLESNYHQPEQELVTLVTLLQEADFLLVDSYFVSRSYFEKLHALLPSSVKIGYIDDLQSYHLPVHLMINYDLDADKSLYTDSEQVLAGGAYAPLRPQFENRKPQIRNEVRNLLLCCGGGDEKHLLPKISSALLSDATLKQERIRIQALAGVLHPDLDALYALQETCPRFALLQGVKDMASLMLSCDLAICAGGTTLYELCASGLPSVCFLMAKNQRSAVSAFLHAGLVSCAGSFEDESEVPEEKTLQNILSETKKLLPASIREARSKNMQAAIDGKGAMRIASAILYG